MKPIGSEKTRLLFLVLYFGLLFGANRVAFGSWMPAADKNGLWFAAGALSLLLGSFLVTPYFERPANHIASAVVALVACWQSFDWLTLSKVEKFVAASVLTYLALIFVLSASAVLLRSQSEGRGVQFGATVKELVDHFGNDKFIFSLVILSAVGLFHRDSDLEVYTILFVWVVVVLLRPEAYILSLLGKIRTIWGDSKILCLSGEIAGFDEPGIVLLRQPEENAVFGDFLIVNDRGSKAQISQVLGYFGRDFGALLRAKLLDLPEEVQGQIEDIAKVVPEGSVAKFRPTGKLKGALDENDHVKLASRLVGLVAENTTINKLYVEVIREGEISEGDVLEATIKGAPVLYQITDGLAREESVFQRNTRGFACAEARKIGRWDSDKRNFKLARWIPAIHSAVRLSSGPQEEIDETAVGNLPSTKYPVRIKSLHELVTHNTAILGILGVGKSFFAIELIERMFAEGIKVVCLDLTNQYAQELAAFYDAQGETECVEGIRAAAQEDRETVSESRSEGGSIENMRSAIHEDLAAFLSDQCPSNLKIYNPAQVNATIQVGDVRNKKIGPGKNDWAQVAAFKESTPAEFTRIVTECCLALCQDQMRDRAKVCLVFEEAHSLVPEFNNVTVDSDKHAVAGTARAILQGRKYGMGCLLISQRTANVTKTILNQCNTVAAFRTFDDTGMAFLENYLGSGYARVLPSIEERHAVFFGKASSCENPVLMRVNDRDKFLSRYRAKYPVPGQPPTACISQKVEGGPEEEAGESDGFPF